MHNDNQPLPAVILVDDEPDLLNLLSRYMRRFAGDYDIIAVSNGSQALEQINQRAVPLVITDHRMPGMSGLQLAALLKQQLPETYVVLMSGEARLEFEQQQRASCIDDYLPKPFPLDHLRQIIQRVLA